MERDIVIQQIDAYIYNAPYNSAVLSKAKLDEFKSDCIKDGGELDKEKLRRLSIEWATQEGDRLDAQLLY